MATTAPNHHAHHAGFSGPMGLLGALTMAVGREGDARLAIQLTGLTEGDRLVDIGCGPGVAARAAARAGATVTAVDPAPVMLTVGRRLVPTSLGVSFVEGAAEALPLPDGDATIVWTQASVHHWRDLDAGLAEVHRLLRPGGRFLAVERQTTEGATGLRSHGWTHDQATAFAGQLRDAGFVDVAVDRHPRRRRPLVSVRATRP